MPEKACIIWAIVFPVILLAVGAIATTVALSLIYGTEENDDITTTVPNIYTTTDSGSGSGSGYYEFFEETRNSNERMLGLRKIASVVENAMNEEKFDWDDSPAVVLQGFYDNY